MALGEFTKKCKTYCKTMQTECNKECTSANECKQSAILVQSECNSNAIRVQFEGNNANHIAKRMQTECKNNNKIKQCCKRAQNEYKQSATQSTNKSASNNGPSGLTKECKTSAIRVQFDCNSSAALKKSATRVLK